MRFQWKNFSFELPRGFEIQPEYVPPADKTPQEPHSQPATVPSSGCLTIFKESTYTPGAFPISENPDDLNPRAARVTIALTSIQARYAGPPLRYLQQSVRVLPEYLQAFQVTTCEAYRVGRHTAARVHYSFETNFRIDQFIIAWRVADEILTATMTIPECEPEAGWRVLQPFINTFRD